MNRNPSRLNRVTLLLGAGLVSIAAGPAFGQQFNPARGFSFDFDPSQGFPVFYGGFQGSLSCEGTCVSQSYNVSSEIRGIGTGDSIQTAIADLVKDCGSRKNPDGTPYALKPGKQFCRPISDQEASNIREMKLRGMMEQLDLGNLKDLVSCASCIAQTPLDEKLRADAQVPPDTESWRSQTIQGTISKDGITPPAQDIVLERIHEHTDRVPHADTCTEKRIVSHADQCPILKCDEPGNPGKSQTWIGYANSATSEDRAYYLRQGLSGITPSGAMGLATSGFLNQVPATWDAFVQAMGKARQSGKISAYDYYQVVQKNQTDTAQALGYRMRYTDNYGNSFDANGKPVTNQYGHSYSCYPSGLQSCRVYEEQDLSHSCTVYQNITRSTVVAQQKRHLDLGVSGQKLQSFEVEPIYVTVDHYPEQQAPAVNLSGTSYNRYQASASGNGVSSRIQVTGSGRNQVSLPSDSNQGSKLERNGGSLNLQVNVDPKYLPEDPANGSDQLLVRYQVYVCKPSWIGFGHCFGDGDPQAIQEKALTQSQNNIDISVPKGSRASVRYTIYRKGSPWYKDTPLSGPEKGMWKTDYVTNDK